MSNTAQAGGTLDGKTALVVGASRGIGLVIAQALAREGAHVILAARSQQSLEKEAAAITQQGGKAEVAVLDVADLASIDALAERLPPVDILLNVSGINQRKPMQDYTTEEYNRVLQTNLHGLFRLTQHVGRQMIQRQQGGKIVFVGSLMSLLGLPYLSVYAITKSALAGLTRTLAAEWGRHNIQVNCIAPGFILTDLNREMWQSEIMHKWLTGVQASPEMGTPEDIAPLAVLLSGPGSRYITGQVIAVDGGYSTTAVWPYEPPAA